MTTPLTDSEIAEMERLVAIPLDDATMREISRWHNALDVEPVFPCGGCGRGWDWQRYRYLSALERAAPALLAAAKEANRLSGQVETLRIKVAEATGAFYGLQASFPEGHPQRQTLRALYDSCERALASTLPDAAGGKGE